MKMKIPPPFFIKKNCLDLIRNNSKIIEIPFVNEFDSMYYLCADVDILPKQI